MPKRKRTDMAVEAERRNQAQLARLGGDLRDARRRRRRTQGQVAAAAGIARSTVSAIERGHAGSHTLDTLQRVALASGRPLLVGLQRDPFEETADAGHLAMQELVLRLGRRAGFTRSFELAVPAE